MFNFCLGRARTNIATPFDDVPLVVQRREDTSQLRGIYRSIYIGPTEKDLQELPKFGPLYSTDEASIFEGYKKEAWEHVLQKTGGDILRTKEIYVSAIRDVETKAIDAYVIDGATAIENETEFRNMMVMDGCFLLQLAILLLGGGSVLGYPEDHVIFGRSNRNDMKRWLKSMFYTGNQIPLVVLQKLMEQRFFNSIREARVWKHEEPSDLFRRALYNLLFAPCTQVRNSCWQITFPGLILRKNCQWSIQQSSDLLHGLHSFVIGTNQNPNDDNGQDIDLELGDVDDDSDSDEDIEFPSVTELHQAGISFKNEKGIGSRGIYLKANTFSSVLVMPTFVVDDDTELMFQSLKTYEMAQQHNGHKREVSAYLKFMSELVQTTEDVRLLASKGIIKADPIHKEKLPNILKRLASDESSQNLRHLRLQINECSRPRWGKLKEVISIVLVLTLLQTIFTILAFFKPQGAKTPSSP